MLAFLFQKPYAKLEDINLDKYENLINEPRNSTPCKDNKVSVEEIINSSFNGRIAKHAAYHRNRKFCFFVKNWLLSFIKNHSTVNAQ